MEYSRGHYFCSSPHPDPKQYYDARHLVSFDKYAVEIRSTADCVPANHHPYWDRILEEKLAIVPPDPSTDFDKYAKIFKCSVDKAKEILARRVHYPVLRDNVVDWLNAHVAPSTDIRRVSMTDGWVVYSDKAMINNATSNFTIFFLRRRDALKFIKVWSDLGKPTKMFKQ